MSIGLTLRDMLFVKSFGFLIPIKFIVKGTGL